MKSRDITRRGFLKSSAMSIAALSLPLETMQAIAASVEDMFKKHRFQPDHEYFNYLDISKEVASNHLLEKKVLKALIKDLRKHIPSKYLHRVQFRKRIPGDFGRKQAIAWYYHPNNTGYIGLQGKWEYQSGGAYYLWVKA